MKRLPVLIAVLALSGAAAAEDATTPSDVSTPYPTITNLAVEWRIQGDDNLNGVVTVRFRRADEKDWHEGMPLRRTPAGKSKGTNPTFEWDNKHSGSIFDLRPDTEYEFALKLADPDGGAAERTVRVRTRAVLRAAAGAPAKKVTPATLKDAAAAAKPGDILLLEPGDYGDFAMPAADGAPGRPVVIRSSGGAKFTGVSLRGRKFVMVEGLTVAGSINLMGAEECAVRRCAVTVAGKSFGIGAPGRPGARNCYIADNGVAGSTPWQNEAMGANGKNAGEGIQITGPGNVICFNRVTGFRDCLSTMEDRGVADQLCVDMYNNDIYSGADDGIEADFAQGNCRIMRNRLTNCFTGLSSQPGLGGPTYFIRNVMYNLTYAPFKLHRQSIGDVFLHNTVVKIGDGMACFSYSEPFDFTLFRNNLCIGGPSGGQKFGGYGCGPGQPAFMVSAGTHCSFDYDALGSHGMPFRGRIGQQRFSSFEELVKGPFERNAVLADLGVFAQPVAFPEPPIPERPTPDLRPREGSAVVDRGERIPNVNDDFRGKAPDIGAYEAGQPLPHYGPRPEGVDESTAAAAPAAP